MKSKPIEIPMFANEAEEADWWASGQGAEFVETKRRRHGKGSVQGVAPRRPDEPASQRSDSAAFARTGRRDSASTGKAQGDRVSDSAEDAGA